MNSTFKNRVDVMIVMKNTGKELNYIDEYIQCTKGIFRGKKEYMTKDVAINEAYEFKFQLVIPEGVKMNNEISEWKMFSDITQTYFGETIQFNLNQLLE